VTEPPRIAPGGREEIGWVNAAIVRVIGLAAGGKPPHVFTTLARNRRLFRRWLWFAGGLMPGGKLPRKDTELVILGVAHLTDNAYEWGHHERLGARAGLSPRAAPSWRRRATTAPASGPRPASPSMPIGMS